MLWQTAGVSVNSVNILWRRNQCKEKKNHFSLKIIFRKSCIRFPIQVISDSLQIPQVFKLMNQNMGVPAKETLVTPVIPLPIESESMRGFA